MNTLTADQQFQFATFKIGDCQGVVADVLKKSVAEGTLEQYQRYIDEFIQDAARDSVAFELGEERARFYEYCRRRVEEDHHNPENLKKLRTALGKLYVVAGMEGESWLAKEAATVTAFFKGLGKIHQDNIAKGLAKAPVLRLDMPEPLVDDLVAEARAHGRPDLAIGYKILVRALFRHSHIGLICRGDLVFLGNSDDALLYLWNFKQNSTIQEGAYVHLPGMKEELQELARGKKMHERLFPMWSEDGAVAFLRDYCIHRGLDHMKFDIHCLRGSGVSHLRKQGKSLADVRTIGMWTAQSRRFQVYARMPSPETKALIDRELSQPRGQFKPGPLVTRQRARRPAVQKFLERRQELFRSVYGDKIPGERDQFEPTPEARQVEESLAREFSSSPEPNIDDVVRMGNGLEEFVISDDDAGAPAEAAPEEGAPARERPELSAMQRERSLAMIMARAARERSPDEGLEAKRPRQDATAIEQRDGKCVECHEVVRSGYTCRGCHRPVHPRSATFQCAAYGKCHECRKK